MRINAFDENTWTESERFYFEYVEGMLESGANIVVKNGRPIHAIYLIEAFLRKAKNTVRLFSGTLKQRTDELEMYGDSHVVTAARNFLSQPGADLRIVLESHIDLMEGQGIEDHPMIDMAYELWTAGRMGGAFRVRRADEDNVEFLRREKFCHHMMIIDERAYRLETDTEKFKAHVNFGNAKTTGKLSQIFDRILFDSGKTLVSLTD